MGYETIRYKEDGPIGTLTLNRPDDGNIRAIECRRCGQKFPVIL